MKHTTKDDFTLTVGLEEEIGRDGGDFGEVGHLPVSWRTKWPPTVSLVESTEQLVDTLREGRREGGKFPQIFEVHNSSRKVKIMLRERYVV